MKNGSRILLKGEGDQDTGQREAGDVVIILQEKAHDTYVRKGLDLHMDMTVRGRGGREKKRGRKRSEYV